MLAHYGVDVLDPKVSVRRVWNLVRRLPPGTWPDEHSPMSWSVESHLLATVIDALAGLTYVTLRANGAKPPKPKPIGRPKAKPQRPAAAPRSSWAAMAKELASKPEPGVVVVTTGGGD